MTVTHNYLDRANRKPMASESVTHEIVINEVDGSLWTKASDGSVIQLGGVPEGGGRTSLFTGFVPIPDEGTWEFITNFPEEAYDAFWIELGTATNNNDKHIRDVILMPGDAIEAASHHSYVWDDDMVDKVRVSIRLFEGAFQAQVSSGSLLLLSVRRILGIKFSGDPTVKSSGEILANYLSEIADAIDTGDTTALRQLIETSK